MGIVGLIDFLKRFNSNSVQVVREEDFSVLANSDVAVDISTLTYSHLNGIIRGELRTRNPLTPHNPVDRRRVWIDSFLYRMETFLRIGCRVVAVFDGEASVMKNKTQQKRRDTRKKLAEEIEVLKTKLENMPPLDRTTTMVDELRKKMSQQIDLPSEWVEELKSVLQLSGISVVQATGEAERTCAVLAREGIVQWVISTDSDCIAHLTPKTVTKILDGGKIQTVRIDDVLSVLQLNPHQFQELCVASGCDYNEGVTGCSTILNMINHDGSSELMRVCDIAKSPIDFTQFRELYVASRCDYDRGYCYQIQPQFSDDRSPSVSVLAALGSIPGCSLKKATGSTIVTLYPLIYKLQSYQGIVFNNPAHNQKNHRIYSEVYMDSAMDLFRLLPSEELTLEPYQPPKFETRYGLNEALEYYQLGHHFAILTGIYRNNRRQEVVQYDSVMVTDFSTLR